MTTRRTTTRLLRRAASLCVLACLPAVPASARPDAEPGAPLVWFAPLPHETVVGRQAGFDGSKDFLALFERGAAWPRAAQRVGVFKLYGGWAANEARAVELERIVRDLDRRGIALAVEDGALQGRDGCGHGVEGFVPPNQATRIATRIKAAGGNLRYVALDSTFRFGSLYEGSSACRFTAEEAARQFAAYATELHRVFPDALVGDIEALPPDVDPARLVEWMDAYRRVTGRPLDFFHLDMGYRRLDWPQAARTLERAARERGIPFGIIYFGEGSQRDGGGSDLDWTANAEQRFVAFEAQDGGRPDHAILQSWVEFPDYVLPESKPATFTWLVNRYLRPRPALTVRTSPTGTAGRLLDAHGRPVGAASIELTARPLAGPGAPSTYALSGTVPGRATSAAIGLRINTECGCSGSSDVALHDAQYSEGTGGANLVPAQDRWQVQGDAAVALDSPEFSVSPRARFRFSVTARVAPHSSGSGYFSLIFRNAGVEVGRRTIPLAAASTHLGTARTRPDGTFARRVRGAAGLVEAWYRGSATRFPAYASATAR